MGQRGAAIVAKRSNAGIDTDQIAVGDAFDGATRSDRNQVVASRYKRALTVWRLFAAIRVPADDGVPEHYCAFRGDRDAAAIASAVVIAVSRIVCDGYIVQTQ